jgi:hypothetical protein
MRAMKVEYDPTRDVLCLWWATPGTTAASTTVVSPGVHVDFDMDRVPFLNELGRHRISVVNYSPEALTREIEEAKQRARNE